MPDGPKQIAAARAAAANPVSAPDLRPVNDSGGMLDEISLGPDCPVTCLGHSGSNLHFLDYRGQYRSLSTKCDKGEIMLLFGTRVKWLEMQDQLAHWVRDPDSPKGKPLFLRDGFNQRKVQEALILECAKRGIFEPKGKIRGRGTHRSERGGLVLHMGDEVWIAAEPNAKGLAGRTIKKQSPGYVGKYIYPALERLPPPADAPASTAVAEQLLALFAKWYWARPDIAPLLLLGLYGETTICGAVQWRAHGWLTGPTAAGKSALQSLFKYLLDDWCLQSNDATEAAVRQLLANDTLPVFIDEAEADSDSEKQKRIINLARLASSGGMVFKGGADHKGQEFRAQSCFMFSSILHSPLQSQDRNRIAILDMHEVPNHASPLDINPDYWREAGRAMQRRMLDQWPRFDRTLADYKLEISRNGFKGREQDQYGTLLACADMLLFDDAPSACDPSSWMADRCAVYVQKLVPMLMLARVEGQDDTARCLAYLASVQLPGAHGSAPETIARWIERALALDDDGSINKNARERLRSCGLRVVNTRKSLEGKISYVEHQPGADTDMLAIAYASNAGIGPLFKGAGSEWANGGWVQSLSRVPGAQKMKVHFAGRSDNAVVIPVKALMVGDD